jgi:tetratricopeptide (TPR) repeat protein
MPSLPPAAEQALALARRGDYAAAIEASRPALAAHADDSGLRLFVAQLHSSLLDLDGALAHVRRALEIAPGHAAARIELVRLLVGLGALDEAEEELGAGSLPGLEPARLRAMILARSERPDEAIPLLSQVVQADARDHESWGNLGACYLATSRPVLAAQAFARAAEQRPDIDKYRDKRIEARINAGESDAVLAEARAAARAAPDKAGPLVTQARIEALLTRTEEAVATLRAALALEPDHGPALAAFADLLERTNQIDELDATIGRIADLDPQSPQLPLLRARLELRRGRFAEALELARALPEHVDRGSRAEVIGRAEDRLGRHDAAFAAFEAMNADSGFSPQTIANRAAALRAVVDERSAMMDRDWVGRWTNEAPPAPHRDPAFLIGFPRSGTTLLDTFLMGHPDICVAEEKPMLQAVSAKLGPYERLAALDAEEIAALRDCYFETAASHVPELGGRLLIDKYPLGAIDIAIIHRLFPKARIIFAERHPLDVVLSCFFTRFQPTATLVSFLTLRDAALLYDGVMGLWTRARDAMPLKVHSLRYEQLVSDPEPVMRGVIDFLGLDWDERAASHEHAANQRGVVTSASYAQVAEPLYDRSIGRWKHYRRHLQPVLPILRPWADALGYDI